MTNTNKISERDLDFIVLYILDKHPNIDTSTLKKYIWYYTEPDGENLIPLIDRNDVVIDQIVRNIICHRYDSTKNIIYRGLVSYNEDEKRLNITNSGQDALASFIKQKAL